MHQYAWVKACTVAFATRCLHHNRTSWEHCSPTPEATDRTFDLIDSARQLYAKLGCTLPGRWRRSLTDADRAITLGLRVRVVKGEWPEGTGNKADPANGFLDIIDRLVLISFLHRLFRRLRTAGTSCEPELLYGLPLRRMLELARAFNVLTRMYVPYGTSGLPYRLKQAARNPRISKYDMFANLAAILHSTSNIRIS